MTCSVRASGIAITSFFTTPEVPVTCSLRLPSMAITNVFATAEVLLTCSVRPSSMEITNLPTASIAASSPVSSDFSSSTDVSVVRATTFDRRSAGCPCRPLGGGFATVRGFGATSASAIFLPLSERMFGSSTSTPRGDLRYAGRSARPRPYTGCVSLVTAPSIRSTAGPGEPPGRHPVAPRVAARGRPAGDPRDARHANAVRHHLQGVRQPPDGCRRTTTSAFATTGTLATPTTGRGSILNRRYGVNSQPALTPPTAQPARPLARRSSNGPVPDPTEAWSSHARPGTPRRTPA